MSTLHRLTGISLLVIIALVATTAGEEDGDGAASYDEHRIVRLNLDEPRQIQQVLALGVDPWACKIPLGESHYLVNAAQLATLRHMNLHPKVVVDDVQAMLDAHLQQVQQARAAAGADDWFATYRTWTEVNDYMDELVGLRPDIAEKFEVGTTHEGRTIYGMRITGPGEDKPAVLFNGIQHAREWIAVMVPMYIADQLVRQYDDNPAIQSIVDQVEFFIVPIVNPDGYVYTHADDGDRFWRKNRRINVGSGCIGVDLNRNWNVDWNGGNSTSTDPCSNVFVGPSPMSEPEVQAMAAFIDNRPMIRAHIDYHSYSELILHPLGYTNDPVPDYDAIENLAFEMRQAILDVHGVDYPHGTPGNLLYFASGIFPDWNYQQTGKFAYTIELRPSSSNPGFLLPPEQIIPTCEENFPAAMALANKAAQGVLFDYPDGVPDALTIGEPTSFALHAEPVTSGPIASDTATLYWRFEGEDTFNETDIDHVGGAQYAATLPAVSCGDTVEFFIELAGETGAMYRSPHHGPSETAFFVADADASTCAGDLDGDNTVGVSDLLILLGEWGPCADSDNCPADFDGDGTVGVSDLLTLLANWDEALF